jgi:sulfur carrier protein ThiS
MIINIEKDQQKKEIEFSGSVLELLELLDINRETVIVVRNNEILDENAVIDNNDEVSILSVVSGG